MTTTQPVECPGVLVEWKPGSVWSTYPYHRHLSHDFPWQPIGVENEQWLRIRSDECARVLADGALVCPECKSVPQSARFATVVDRATKAPLNTQHWMLTYAQLHGALKKRKLSTLRKKINDHQRLTMLLATNDVKRLRELLAVALRKGASPRTLISQIERSLAGLYNLRGGFNQRELDVAFLAKALGGPRLLFALVQSHGFPSASTLSRNVNVPRLRACIGRPTAGEVNTNISALFDPQLKTPMLIRSPDPISDAVAGLVMMIDGIALEERCRYYSEENCVVGLCREHSHGLRIKSSNGRSGGTLDPSRTSGSEPAVHYGKDGTVAALAPYANSEHYAPVPLIVSASCKAESSKGLISWLKVVLDAWKVHPYGAPTHGPVWTLASDGESSFRRARFLLCMNKRVSPTSPLGQRLDTLTGLNLNTGPDGILGTCDPKHVMKRFATLIRNPKGIQVSDVTLMCHDVYKHMQSLPGMSAEKARQLLDPADKQNVPKAVNLLESLMDLQTHASPPSLPSEIRRRETISFVADVLGHFTLPFISITMSLSEQIRSLSTYAHVAAVMWLQHGTRFITGALYADSQAIIKNIVFTVARLQLVDADLPFYLILEGTDRLEGIFSDCRTQDHSRNFDILQLAEKLSTGSLVQSIFERNPDLDRGHRRLVLKDARGVDHINPKSWIGNARVGDVELAAEWMRGQDDAYFGHSARVDFNALFQTPGRRDLLRPNGEYVGCEYRPDDARTEDPEVGSALNRDQTSATSLGTTAAPSPASPAHHPMHPTHRSGQTQDAVENETSDDEDDGACDDLPEGLELDDFFSSRADSMTGESPFISNDKWLLIDGKKYLKASVITIILTAKRSRKVTMRTLRARGVTIEDLHGGHRNHDRFNAIDLAGEDLIKSGDLAAMLVRVGKDICLAVVEILQFELDGQKARRVTAVELTMLEPPQGSKVKVLVQLLKLRSVQDLSDAAAATTWLWSHQYIGITMKTSTSRPLHSLYAAGDLLYPLGPRIVESHSSSAEAEATRSLADVTWALSDAQLHEMLDMAWSALNPETEEILSSVERLPLFVQADGLPYRSQSGPDLIVTDVPVNLTAEKLSGNTSVRCYLCGDKTQLSRMRDHIGTAPCGFCGRETCVTRLSKPGTSYKVSSSCPYHYTAMRYTSAQKTTERTKCTNLPIHCPWCPSISPGQPATAWKYNMMNHILTYHATDSGMVPDIPAQLVVDMHISKEEECLIGVSEETTDRWREELNAPGSDDLDHAREVLGLSPVKRDRGLSMVEVERMKKSARTR
ncbi:hypothetical protein C8Q80DRAFT_1096770 [Daedaleopsis nitida]|nr:hypothetical protein C8Q80DRAFT_1096770 [Daedaleopsis nitida]